MRQLALAISKTFVVTLDGKHVFTLQLPPGRKTFDELVLTPGPESASLLQALGVALETQVPLPGEKPGTLGPVRVPFTWLDEGRTKWFLGDSGELYFNFDLERGTAELAEKDEDYNAEALAALAAMLRDGVAEPPRGPRLGLARPLATRGRASLHELSADTALFVERTDDGDALVEYALATGERRVLYETEAEIGSVISCGGRRWAFYETDDEGLCLRAYEHGKTSLLVRGQQLRLARHPLSPSSRFVAYVESHPARTRRGTFEVLHVLDRETKKTVVVREGEVLFDVTGWRDDFILEANVGSRAIDVDARTGAFRFVDRAPQPTAQSQAPQRTGDGRLVHFTPGQPFALTSVEGDDWQVAPVEVPRRFTVTPREHALTPGGVAATRATGLAIGDVLRLHDGRQLAVAAIVDDLADADLACSGVEGAQSFEVVARAKEQLVAARRPDEKAEPLLAALDMESSLERIQLAVPVVNPQQPDREPVRSWPRLPDALCDDDLRELYRRITARSQKLDTLLNMKAPDIIVENERRQLQAAIDALVDNESCEVPMKRKDGRPFRGLLPRLAELTPRPAEAVIVARSDVEEGVARVPRAAVDAKVVIVRGMLLTAQPWDEAAVAVAPVTLEKLGVAAGSKVTLST